MDTNLCTDGWNIMETNTTLKSITKWAELQRKGMQSTLLMVGGAYWFSGTRSYFLSSTECRIPSAIPKGNPNGLILQFDRFYFQGHGCYLTEHVTDKKLMEERAKKRKNIKVQCNIPKKCQINVWMNMFHLLTPCVKCLFKTQAPACSVSDKGPGWQLKLLMFQPNRFRFQNMCHFLWLTTTSCTIEP